VGSLEPDYKRSAAFDRGDVPVRTPIADYTWRFVTVARAARGTNTAFQRPQPVALM
jgi:hypothetical protein